MSKASYTLYIIIVTLILAGCQGESKYYSRLCALDSVLVQSPDSVYKVLVAEEKEAQQQSRSDRMYYELLRADAQNKAYIDFTTDSIMKEVAEYYDNHGTANQQIRAHYLLGCTYRDLGDAPSALECYLNAICLADSTKSNCDKKLLMTLHSQMASLYKTQHLIGYAIFETSAAYKDASECRDSVSMANLMLQNAQLYLMSQDYKKSKELAMKADSISRKNNIEEFSRTASLIQAQICIA